MPRRRMLRAFLALTCCATLLCANSAAHGEAEKKVEGARLFASSGCAHCHGATGEGTDSGPSLRDVHRKLKKRQIETQIVAGGGAMPAFGKALDPEQVKALVAFLRAKTWVVPSPDQPSSESRVTAR